MVVLRLLIVAFFVSTGHGLLPQEIFSSGFDIAYDQVEPLLTRRIRQSNGLSNSIEENNQLGNQDRIQLICHQCRAFDNGNGTNGDKCIHLPANSSLFSKPCGLEHTTCMVKRFSFTENSTTPVSLWYIERNCTSKCEPGCLILGERTKVYACTSCCNQDECNTGNGAKCLSLNLAAIIVFFFITYSTQHIFSYVINS